MFFTGFADEAAVSLAGQIAATKQLGWKYIEARSIDKVNLHELPEDKFEKVCEMLQDAGIEVNCFGSTVANWQYNLFKEEDFLTAKDQLARAIRRMKVLNCKLIRGMSFRMQLERPAFDPAVEAAAVYKVGELVKMCEDAGVIYGHENCNNYGGQSWKHSLRLVEKIHSPNFKLIYDTGNPVKTYDRAWGDQLLDLQCSWNFYRHVRDYICYVHIKDAVFDPNLQGRYTFPGEGDGCVRAIVRDLLRNGYDGGFSMEPHMVRVYHDPAAGDDSVNDNYVEYGRRFEKLVSEVKAELAQTK